MLFIQVTFFSPKVHWMKYRIGKQNISFDVMGTYIWSFHQTMTDELTTVSIYSYVWVYPVYRNTKLMRKGNQSFSLHDIRACSDNCLLISTDHGTKQENVLQIWRRSLQRFFIYVLYFVVIDQCALLRMESINIKTEINELRICKVESRIETESLQTTDHKNVMETPESK